MDLQNIDLGFALLVAGGLCMVGIVVLLVVQVFGTLFGAVFNFIELFGQILSGGPLAWCGCLLFVGACGVCAGTIGIAVSILSTCGTPNAVNFCAVFGR